MAILQSFERCKEKLPERNYKEFNAKTFIPSRLLEKVRKLGMLDLDQAIPPQGC
jgi:hypothetical protein